MDNPPDDGPCEVTITAPDRDWLQGLVRQLVQDRLAAAAHVDGMRTTYRWAGRIEEGCEARCILHTTLSHVSEIERLVRLSHPYAVPCIVATPITTGDSSYIQWIKDETAPLDV